ncbi:hypothetical protein [Burkholderia gladioli]|uniref:hypothetical protein n=1 Tax=Burkholderia gladioli TaxID=28095 RepID=UPI000F52E604|nr:hypothetical protein [Burkholderia gladioli]
MKNTLTAILSLLFFIPLNSASAKSTHEKQATPGKSYVCQFGKYGVVVIDTRDPGASISIDGVRYPATDGSYFYQTSDRKIAIAFNPKMTTWTLMSEEDSEEITDAHCKVKLNNK